MKNITKSDIIDFLKKQVSEECAIPLNEVLVDAEFIQLGMDSLKAVYIMDRLEKFVAKELSPLYFWNYPTIDSLAGFITTEIMNGGGGEGR